MFGQGIVPKETGSPLFNLVYLIIFLTKLLEIGCLGQAWHRRRSYLAYSTHLIEDIRLAPGNVVMVATDMCRKSPSRGSGYMGLRENIFLTIFFIFKILWCLYHYSHIVIFISLYLILSIMNIIILSYYNIILFMNYYSHC